MLNYWWVTRPKRRLNSVPEVLAAFAEISLDQEWQGQRETHLTLEDALEEANLKRIGERRDQTGGGARTYAAWMESLGLIFTQESTGRIKLTLAGEAIMNGDSPVDVLRNQVLKYQFPSAFSKKRGVNLSPRFKIRPFVFLLRLLQDSRVEHLSEEEIAKIVVVEAESESDTCFESIVRKIQLFRSAGDSCLDADFVEKYAPGKGHLNPNNPFAHLSDIANTIINWLEYTQLAKRDAFDKKLRIIDDKRSEVQHVLDTLPPFIDRPEEKEYFQRKYGLDLKHLKDTRNLTENRNITAKVIADQKIKQAFIGEALRSPIARISNDLIEKISLQTGFSAAMVEEALLKSYPRGAIGAFMTEYFDMAFSGRENAIAFEKATVEIFQNVFGFDALHTGSKKLAPDVVIVSDTEGFAGIIDNKAYSNYTISNDHRNRMIYNYIPQFKKYSQSSIPLSFFSYLAGGFGKSIDGQIRSIADETLINGSAISVSNVIKLIAKHTDEPYKHSQIREIFSVDRQVRMSDL